MKVDLGLTEKGRESVSEALGAVLADTFLLALKTQNYHWNVVGSDFTELHQLFEEQYTALRDAGDEVAERIRALGHPAPGSFATYLKLASLKEATGKEDAQTMLKNLAQDHDTVTKACRKAKAIAEQHGDDESVDLLIERMSAHGKFAWMLRSHLG